MELLDPEPEADLEDLELHRPPLDPEKVALAEVALTSVALTSVALASVALAPDPRPSDDHEDHDRPPDLPLFPLLDPDPPDLPLLPLRQVVDVQPAMHVHSSREP